MHTAWNAVQGLATYEVIVTCDFSLATCEVIIIGDFFLATCEVIIVGDFSRNFLSCKSVLEPAFTPETVE